MPLTSTIVEYTTDDGKKCNIKINYETNVETKLTEGGFTAVTTGCTVIIPRKHVKPRYVDTMDGTGTARKRVRRYFATHDKWKNYINTNSASVVQACGECLSCTAVQLLY